jgi:putative oxidoreductase
MKALSNLGRFIYAIPFLVFGIFHFMSATPMADNILKGWPVAEGLVYISGLALILAAISIILNIKARIATLMLALLLLIIIIGVQIPGVISGDQAAMSALLKDTSLLGAALTYSGILKK